MKQRWPERHPVALGLAISSSLVAGLIVQTALLDRYHLMRSEPVVLMIFRIAVSHCLMTGYFVGAYYALLRGTRRNVHELRKTLEPTDTEWSEDSAVRISKRTLVICCTIALVAAVAMPYLSSPTPPWDPSTWPPEVWWHRILGVFAAVRIGIFFAAVIDLTAKTSQLADWIDAVDLFDLSPWFPFVRQGLLTSLLVIGGMTVQAARLYEPAERMVLAVTYVATLPLALLGLWLPVRGAHRRIRQAKEAELDWIEGRIRQASEGLRTGTATAQTGEMADLVAYRRLVDDAREWPFRPSTAVQFALYLLIPIASWLGGLLIEGLLDRILT